jgi:hypothetical protein
LAIGNFATTASALGVALLALTVTIVLASTASRNVWALVPTLFFLLISLYCGLIARGEHIKMLLATGLTREGIAANKRLNWSSKLQMWTIVPAIAFLVVFAASNVELHVAQRIPSERTTNHPIHNH